jgi:microcystin-dependent protein
VTILGAASSNTELADTHSHPGGSEAFPVGSVFIAVVSTNPATLLGYGTWSAFGAGRMLVGLDAGQAEFDTVEETGGAKTVTLAEADIPSHTHVQNAHSHNIGHVRSATTGAATTHIARTDDTSSTLGTATSTDSTTPTNQNTGGGGAHNNLPPYVVVYMWRRTA